VGRLSNVGRLLEWTLGSSNYSVLRVMLGRFDDFSGYEKLIDYIEANGIGKLKGDFLEIGAFMGGGSAKLARCARRYGKRLIVIDLFDPSFDHTQTADGKGPLNFQYQQLLGRKNQREAFDQNTRFEKNIIVYAEDSKLVKLPPDTQLCFSFIDGNHDPAYVSSDFYLAWNATVPGGIVAFHDYDEAGGNLPQLTNAVNRLIESNRSAINNKCWIRETAMLLLQKR
jgi:predicted O-methyltransferase YrrM